MLKKRFLYLLLGISLILLIGFFLWKHRPIPNSQPVLSNKGYKPLLDSIKTVKKKLRKAGAGTVALEKKFIQLLNGKIFTYWYGTKWGFYGTTQMPNEGEIACGYFVTTTLRDMGFPINRTKLAQCASEEMIRSLVQKKNIHHLSGIDINEFDKRLRKYGNGIYIVGLDNHTGFLSVTEHKSYFIHASGIYPFQVVKEEFSEATLLKKSKYRVVGKISSDEVFLNKWIANE